MKVRRPTALATAAAAVNADAWVREGDQLSAHNGAQPFTARLTLDVTPELRGRIKVAAFRQGRTVADVLRGLLEREFPGEAARTDG